MSTIFQICNLHCKFTNPSRRNIYLQERLPRKSFTDEQIFRVRKEMIITLDPYLGNTMMNKAMYDSILFSKFKVFQICLYYIQNQFYSNYRYSGHMVRALCFFGCERTRDAELECLVQQLWGVGSVVD